MLSNATDLSKNAWQEAELRAFLGWVDAPGSSGDLLGFVAPRELNNYIVASAGELRVRVVVDRHSKWSWDPNSTFCNGGLSFY